MLTAGYKGVMVRGTSKFVLILVACALLAASCTKASNIGPTTTGGGSYGSGVKLPADQKQQTQGAGSASTGKTSGGSAQYGSPGRPTYPPDYNPNMGSGHGGASTIFYSYDSKTLGCNGFYYTNRTIPKLIVEVQAVRGSEPLGGTMSFLQQRLGEVVDKPGGIQILPTSSVLPSRSVWSVKDLQTTEKKYRKHYSDKSAAVIYFMFVDGRADQGELGVAYDGSSDAIFIQSIRGEASTPLAPAPTIEKATVVHEAGHLLSLVNAGYTSPRPHEDSKHPGHSNNTKSVMYWQVDTVGIQSLATNGGQIPTDYDANDKADLLDVRNAKLRVSYCG